MLAMQKALEEEQQKEMALAQNVMSQKKELLNHLAQQVLVKIHMSNVITC